MNLNITHTSFGKVVTSYNVSNGGGVHLSGSGGHEQRRRTADGATTWRIDHEWGVVELKAQQAWAYAEASGEAEVEPWIVVLGSFSQWVTQPRRQVQLEAEVDAG